jgi:hypothetical protein
MDITRQADYELAHNATQSSYAEVREQGRRAIELMNAETPKIAAMRQALVEAHRQGDVDRIKDIHWDVDHHPKEYKNVLANNKLKDKPNSGHYF